jgi:hypothetical protein
MQHQLRVELKDVQPPLWRRLLVPENVTLTKLHLILQAAMGWYDCHPHEYVVGRVHYGAKAACQIDNISARLELIK